MTSEEQIREEKIINHIVDHLPKCMVCPNHKRVLVWCNECVEELKLNK